MTGFLTTHVLDTVRERPAANLESELYRLDGERRTRLRSLTTNQDGRTDGPILPEDAFETGTDELAFHAGDHLQHVGIPGGFLDQVPIRITMAEDAQYHVPLPLCPFGYSTYRGS